MGSERSGNRLRHPLPPMQIAPHRVSPDDPEVYDSVAGEHSFRAEDFPKGILLPGLPFHLGEGWRPAASTRRLGDFFLDGLLRCRGARPGGPLARSQAVHI